MSNIKKTVEDGIIVFTVHITRWSANKKLRIQHTKAREEDLPPADIASLGVRKVFDPKALAPFEAIRKETERLCFNEGTSFFGGVAVPKDEAEEFAKKLTVLKERFDAAKAELEATYEDTLSAWRKAHPGWENALEGELSAEEVMRRFSFGFYAVEIQIGTAGNEAKPETELESHIESSKGAFVTKLYDEIAQMATTYSKDSLFGKEKATVRGLSALHLIRKKMNGLSFIDPRIRPLVEMIDNVLGRMPAAGAIEGAELAMLLGVANILSSKDMMFKFGEQVSMGKDANDLFATMTMPKGAVKADEASQQKLIEPGKPVFAPKAPVINHKPVTPVISSTNLPSSNAGGWGAIPKRSVTLAVHA